MMDSKAIADWGRSTKRASKSQTNAWHRMADVPCKLANERNTSLECEEHLQSHPDCVWIFCANYIIVVVYDEGWTVLKHHVHWLARVGKVPSATSPLLDLS